MNATPEILTPAKGILRAKVNPHMLARLFPMRYEHGLPGFIVLRWGVFLTPYLAARLGDRHIVRVTAEAWDDDIQALRVQLPALLRELHASQGQPYLVVSARPGVPLSAARHMLAKPVGEELLDLLMEVTVDFEVTEG